MAISSVSVSEAGIRRSVCRDRFYYFVQEFWSEVIQEDPQWNWHIEYICDEVQKICERVFDGLPKEYDMVINQPPGTTKSTIISVMLHPWCLTRMPTCKMLGASYTDDLGQDFSRKARRLIESERYQQSFPEIQLSTDQNTKQYYVTTMGGWRQYCTVSGKSPIGKHAHIHVVDDPIDPKSARSKADLAMANQFMNEVLPQRKVRQDLTPLILVMQRLHQDDPAGNRLKNKKIGKLKHICLPAELSKKVKPKRLRKRYVNGLLDPVRLGKKVLKDKKGLGQFVYAGQFLQDPVPLSGGMFKSARIHIENPPTRLYDRVVRFWDKGATADGGDFTAGVKMGMATYNGLPIFVIQNVVRGQWSSDEREDLISQTAKMDGEEVEIGIEQEPGSGGKDSALATVRRLSGYRVEVERPTGDKAIRADAFSVQVNANNVWMLPGEWNQEYLDEMKFFPNSINDDQIDASSGAFRMLTEPQKIAGALDV